MANLSCDTVPEQGREPVGKQSQGWGGLDGRGRDLNLGGEASSEAGRAPECLAVGPARCKVGQQSRDPPPGRRGRGQGTGG